MAWENRVALLTGAAGGIGQELAKGLAQRGTALFLVDVNQESLEALSRQLGENRVAWATTDVTSKEAAFQAVQSCLRTFGQVDYLVNLAGVFGKFTPIKDLPEEDWDRIVDINLKGAFLFSQAILPHMMERRFGRIVNMSSDLARRGSVGFVPYIAAKAGIVGLTRALAMEGAPHGVTVNALAPSVVDTAMPRGVMSEEALGQMAKINPTGRIGLPSDVANTILFLLQDESNYLNGQTIAVNGGLL